VQVVSYEYSTENGFSSTGSMQASGLAAGIYPIYASSRLIVMFTVAGIFQWPTANSYGVYQVKHQQTGAILGSNNMAYALSYLGPAGDGNYRGDNASNTFYPASYGTTGLVSFQLFVNPVNGTVQFNRDNSSVSTITIIEVKQ
jgi:hypothetical protein